VSNEAKDSLPSQSGHSPFPHLVTDSDIIAKFDHDALAIWCLGLVCTNASADDGAIRGSKAFKLVELVSQTIRGGSDEWRRKQRLSVIKHMGWGEEQTKQHPSCGGRDC